MLNSSANGTLMVRLQKDEAAANHLLSVLSSSDASTQVMLFQFLIRYRVFLVQIEETALKLLASDSHEVRASAQTYLDSYASTKQ